jgi:hypothetical protein
MRELACVVVLALASLACSDPSSPPPSIPAVGTYVYSSTTRGVDVSLERTYTGKITITSASRGGFTAVWDVAGFTTTDRPGFWINIYGAYTISANTTELVIAELRHRIRRTASGLECTGDARVVQNGSVVTQPLTCSMVFQSP